MVRKRLSRGLNFETLEWRQMLAADVDYSDNLLSFVSGNEAGVVDQQTGTDLVNPSVAVAPDGSYVVAYEQDFAISPINDNVHFRRFDANGSFLGHVNVANSASREFNPDIAMDEEGNFAVVYQKEVFGNSEIYVQLFDRNGNRTLAETLVSGGSEDGPQVLPSVAMRDNGEFVVAWEDWNSSPAFTTDIVFRLFNADGTYKTGQAAGIKTVAQDVRNQFDAAYQSPQRVDVAIYPTNGLLMFAFEHYNGTDDDIQFALHNAVGAQTRVPTNVAGGADFGVEEGLPSIAVNTNDFAIAWEDREGANGNFNIKARLFSLTGVTGNIIVTVDETETVNTNNREPSIAANRTDQSFIVAWESAPTGVDSFTVEYSILKRNLTATPRDVEITTAPLGSNTFDAYVGMNTRGDFAIVGTERLTADRIRGFSRLLIEPTDPEYFIADVDNDGTEDFITWDNGSWTVIRSPTPGEAGTQFAYWSPAARWQFIASGDFDGDGRADIIGQTAGNWWVGLSTGSSFNSSRWSYWDPTNNWQDVHVADFDGDGRSDIAGRTEDGHWWVARSTGSGFTSSFWGYWNPANNWENIRYADYNGDGRTDVAAQINGHWWMGISSGVNFQTSFWTYWSTGLSWTEITAADYNGDGLADMAGNVNGQWWVGVSTGSSLNNAYWGYWNPAAGWAHIQPADVNGDGRSDIVGRTGTDWYAALGSATQFNSALIATGWATSPSFTQFFTGDFNGDGLDDLLALSPTTIDVRFL